MAAAVDRISDLPESIRHHILSFLSQKKAIQTSVLSRRWRHVGPTLPKIELRERWFQNSGDASFQSVLNKTLRRYFYRNLTVHEFIFEMLSEPKSKSKADRRHLIGSEFTSNPGKTLFKGLKRLSLRNVHIKNDATLEKIVRSCPSIEYLLVSGFVGYKTDPSKFLDELHLIALKTLSLNNIYISEETLAKIMCGCPLIQRLLLTDCEGLENIKLIKNNNNLKHFSAYNFDRVRVKSIEIDAPTIETIRIMDCPIWYCHDKDYFFPHLKSLYLCKVNLCAELFESLSFDFPSLEELELVNCYGLPEIQEIKLTVCSIKRLVLIVDSIKPIRATIYAPNIQYFKFSGQYPPKLIFYSDATREWKSFVNILDDNKALNWPWRLLELSELLNSLRGSQIYLKFYYNPLNNLKLEDDVFCKPVPLECVSVEGGYKSCSFSDLFNCLFLICRPRYIAITPVTDLKKEKDKLAELTTIGNEGEMSCRYLWVRDLEEISMQVWNHKAKGWRTVEDEGTCFPRFKTSYPRIRFSVKWRDQLISHIGLL